jgi:hypothetical protein
MIFQSLEQWWKIKYLVPESYIAKNRHIEPNSLNTWKILLYNEKKPVPEG